MMKEVGILQIGAVFMLSIGIFLDDIAFLAAAWILIIIDIFKN